MSEQLIRIVLTIAGRQYPVKVEPKEEKAIRSIEKSINQKINEFQIHYKGKDKQDCITMAMLSIAFEQLKPNSSSDLDSIDQKLSGIMELLDA
jgi:cell division protein ZapA